MKKFVYLLCFAIAILFFIVPVNAESSVEILLSKGLYEVIEKAITQNKKVPQTSLSYGNEGRLFFDNGFSVALYGVGTYEDGILVTNAADSAAVTYWEAKKYITDHNSQGFSVMKNYGVGSSAEIRYSDGTSRILRCVGYDSNGYWDDGWPYMSDGTFAWYGPGTWIMQTCNNKSGTSVTLSFWEQEY